MKLLAGTPGPVRACRADGRGYEAAVARALGRLRSDSRRQLHAMTGDDRLADLATGCGSLGRSVVADPCLPACLEGLDRALSFSVGEGGVDVFRDGQMLSPSVVLEPISREHSARMIDAGRFEAAIVDGCTVRVHGVDRSVPEVGEINRLIELAAGTAANTNAYFTGGAVPGLAAHVDSHDVAVIQLIGSKGWVCGEPQTYAPPGVGADAVIGVERWSGKLSTHEVLTIPRGVAHEPRPDGSMSIHLSVGIRRPALSEIFSSALDGSRGLHDDIGQGVLDGVGELAGLSRSLDGEAGRSSVDRVLAAYRFRQPIRRTTSLASHQHAMANPHRYELRWAAPGGVVLAAHAGAPGTVGVASQLIELDDADLGPFLKVLAGDPVGVEAWDHERDGEAAFRVLAGAGVCEPIAKEA